MENEWIRRAGTVQGGGQTEQRYEDTLRTLRERYDEEVQRASGQYEQGLATLQERGRALRQLTEAHKKLLELSPYRPLRDRYEQVSSVELIPAVRDHDPIPGATAR